MNIDKLKIIEDLKALLLVAFWVFVLFAIGYGLREAGPLVGP